MGESNDPRESSREGGRDEGRAAPCGRGGRGKGRHSHTHARAHRGRKRGGGGKDSRAQRAPADAEAPQTQVRGAVGETGACEARKDRVTRGKRAEKEASRWRMCVWTMRAVRTLLAPSRAITLNRQRARTKGALCVSVVAGKGSERPSDVLP